MEILFILNITDVDKRFKTKEDVLRTSAERRIRGYLRQVLINTTDYFQCLIHGDQPVSGQRATK